VPKVLGHLGLQGALHKPFGELLEQAVLAYEVFGLFVVSQQAVDEFVAYGHFASFLKDGSFLPKDRLHKNSYTLILMALAGHKNLSTTQRYLSLSPNLMRSAVELI
jgi:hypothetical protein